MQTPVVSVILTVFKRCTYIDQALSSALAQTLGNIEVIVADDSNSEEVRAVVGKYREDPRVIYRGNPRQLGVALNIKASLESARGRYFSILNDDDFWEPKFLETMVAPLDAEDTRDVSFCDHWVVDQHGRRDEAKTDKNTHTYGRAELPLGDVPDIQRLILEKNIVPMAMASVVRRSPKNVSLVSKEADWAYDFWLACAVAASGAKFHYTPERLTNYRVHQSMETARRSENKYAPMVHIYRTLYEGRLFPKHQEMVCERLAYAIARMGRDKLLMGKPGEGRALLWEAFKTERSAKLAIIYLASLLPASLRKRITFLR